MAISSGAVHRHSRSTCKAGLLFAVSITFPTHAGTTTTTYSYNGDGALTAVAVQVDGGFSTTTYLTWDNFMPSAADPTIGSVIAGDGTLAAVGPQPGGAEQFGFDARERLTTAPATPPLDEAPAGSASYTYHAGGLLASATAAVDKVSFYFGAGEHPNIVNQVDVTDGHESALLAPLRFVDDGSEQVMLRPRKDVQAIFGPVGETVTAYALTPFGAAQDAEVNEGGISDNPFRFAGEYRDPNWGGYYMRGRWYLAEAASFVSRDPRPGLNRFGYGGGNPLMHVDPSGFGFFHALGDLIGDIERGAGKVNAALNKGWWGNLDRFFLAPIMSPLAFVADPKAFWTSIRTDKDGFDIFLALGVASGEGFDFLTELHPTQAVSIFWARVGTGAALSVASATATGADRGFGHFAWVGFRNSLEGGFGNIFDNQLVGGSGYDRFRLKGKDLADGIDLLQSQPAGEAFIFRRVRPMTSPWGEEMEVRTSPVMESLHLGQYHEQIVAVTRDGLYLTELAEAGVRSTSLTATPQLLRPMLEQVDEAQFELVGHTTSFRPDLGEIEGIGRRTAGEQAAARWQDPRTWRGLGNASQRHAAAVLRSLGIR